MQNKKKKHPDECIMLFCDYGKKVNDSVHVIFLQRALVKKCREIYSHIYWRLYGLYVTYGLLWLEMMTAN